MPMIISRIISEVATSSTCKVPELMCTDDLRSQEDVRGRGSCRWVVPDSISIVRFI